MACWRILAGLGKGAESELFSNESSAYTRCRHTDFLVFRGKKDGEMYIKGPNMQAVCLLASGALGFRV